ALNTVSQFTALLDQETAALRASNYNLFDALQDKKIQLAHEYQDAILAFEEDVDLLKDLPASIKDKLRLAHAGFTASADANQDTLMATKNVSERIVTLIMNAARRSVQNGPSYCAGGMQNMSEKIPVHFKLNEVL
ncbi:MAG: hypothetical protein JWM96_293, partial [Alphaproteobacteria bacterium]|nr:hypothetical protein [Alphaproteobacteria bacterium]